MDAFVTTSLYLEKSSAWKLSQRMSLEKIYSPHLTHVHHVHVLVHVYIVPTMMAEYCTHFSMVILHYAIPLEKVVWNVSFLLLVLM